MNYKTFLNSKAQLGQDSGFEPTWIPDFLFDFQKALVNFSLRKGRSAMRHVHPLQLDVIERCITLWSNPGEVVFTPFMGVGSEVYGALSLDRKGIGIELKETYYRQAEKNLELIDAEGKEQDVLDLEYGT